MVRGISLTILTVIFFTVEVTSQNPGQLALPPDMGCTEGPRAATWLSIKKRFRDFFNGSTGTPFKAAPVEDIAKLLESAVADANAVGAFGPEGASDCGFGKIFIQLISIALIDEPAVLAQYISEKPELASPLLTLLLDIPWISMAQSGWPFFGILAQVSYNKQRVLKGMIKADEIDGLGDQYSKAYFEIVSAAQEVGDLTLMAEASGKFLQAPELARASPFATICALSTQAAIQMDVKGRLKTLDMIQDSFRQTMSTPAAFEIGLTARWPFWGLLHVGVDAFAE